MKYKDAKRSSNVDDRRPADPKQMTNLVKNSSRQSAVTSDYTTGKSKTPLKKPAMAARKRTY